MRKTTTSFADTDPDDVFYGNEETLRFPYLSPAEKVRSELSLFCGSSYLDEFIDNFPSHAKNIKT